MALKICTLPESLSHLTHVNVQYSFAFILLFYLCLNMIEMRYKIYTMQFYFGKSIDIEGSRGPEVGIQTSSKLLQVMLSGCLGLETLSVSVAKELMKSDKN